MKSPTCRICGQVAQNGQVGKLVEPQHIFQICFFAINITNKGIIMEILNYACSCIKCMQIYFFLQEKPFQGCLNVLPHNTKLYKHGQAIMKCFTTTSTHYHTRYHIFFFSLIWFESVWNGITRNTGKLIKKCILIYLLKN